jgi:hypothetical protein
MKIKIQESKEMYPYLADRILNKDSKNQSNNVQFSTIYRSTYQTSNNEESIKSHPIKLYSPNSQVDDKFIEVATGQLENDGFSTDQIREIAYYNQLKFELEQELNYVSNKELNSNDGLTSSEIEQLLAPIQSKQYAIQDFLQDKYNLNGTYNNYNFGLDRDSLGFNESGANPTVEEFKTRTQLLSGGLNNQEASDMAYGLNGKTVHSYINGKLVDTGVSNSENVYRHTGNHTYFNDPRNEGKTFNWMNYINPLAIQGQLENDGGTLDYYYATNFVRENQLGTIASTTKNIFNWRSHMHSELVAKYRDSI